MKCHRKLNLNAAQQYSCRRTARHIKDESLREAPDPAQDAAGDTRTSRGRDRALPAALRARGSSWALTTGCICSVRTTHDTCTSPYKTLTGGMYIF